MEKDIRKAYIKYHCKECENRDANLCNITVTDFEEMIIAQCPCYKNSKIH
jgi:hypothetical protein